MMGQFKSIALIHLVTVLCSCTTITKGFDVFATFKVNTAGTGCSSIIRVAILAANPSTSHFIKITETRLGVEKLNVPLVASIENIDIEEILVKYSIESDAVSSPETFCCWYVSDAYFIDVDRDNALPQFTKEDFIKHVSFCDDGNIERHYYNGTLWTCTLPETPSEGSPVARVNSSIYSITDIEEDPVQIATECTNTTTHVFNSQSPFADSIDQEPSSSNSLSSVTSYGTLAINTFSNEIIIPLSTLITGQIIPSTTTTNTMTTTTWSNSAPFTFNSDSATIIPLTTSMSSSSPLAFIPSSQPSSTTDMSSSMLPIVTSRLTSIPITTRSLSPQPTPIYTVSVMCEMEGIWKATQANTNDTVNNTCYDESISGTRRCNEYGEWEEPYYTTSTQFVDILLTVCADPVSGLPTLLDEDSEDLSTDQYIFLIEITVDSLMDSNNDNNIPVTLETTETLLAAIEEAIKRIVNDLFLDRENQTRRGARVLLKLDEFALTANLPLNTTIRFNGIALSILEFNDVPQENITTIQVGQDSITIPPNVFRTNHPQQAIRVASFHYQNISRLLPPRDPNSTIVSSIISATTNCTSCPVDNLDRNVTIQLQIEPTATAKNQTISCVFFLFDYLDNDRSAPIGGDWSTSGCTTVSVDGDLVICSCNHLTHFAILLSPRGPEVDPIHREILNAIGLVLVPISLLCMVMVILTYSLIRSLWSIRNYIHIMLCVSLFMAQLVFIIGVDKIENQDGCSAVAVILLYLFLVTFMWMLMEGVVLYVTLVRVFINNHLYYIISFTVASYAIPAVYLAIVVPIGYLINVEDIPGHTHFLYYDNDVLIGCWLNYQSGFIAAFIVPVCLIVAANVGFFIMAIVIMRKHYKKQEKKKVNVTVRHWLKASLTLTLVMGITWITGVLAFTKYLIAFLYIYTAFVAGQGILLFIILVPLSKQVRDAYLRLLKRKAADSEKLSKLLSFITSSSLVKDSSTNSSNQKNSQKPADSNHNHKTSGGIVLGSIADEYSSSVSIYCNVGQHASSKISDKAATPTSISPSLSSS